MPMNDSVTVHAPKIASGGSSAACNSSQTREERGFHVHYQENIINMFI